MSLFARVMARAGLPGGAPLARAKGIGAAAASEDQEEALQPLRRAEATEEPEAMALRRATGPTPVIDEEDPPAQPLRRAAIPDEAEEEAAPLRRNAVPEDQDDPEARAMRREMAPTKPEDKAPGDQARPLRRAAADKAPKDEAPGDEARPLRRARPDEEPAAPLRPARIARMAPDAQMLDAGNGPKPDLMPDDPGPSPAMALRRFAGALPAVAGAAPAAPGAPVPAAPADSAVPPPPVFATDPPPATPVWSPPPAPARQAADRPRVVIEQVDVVIHEPAPAAPSSPDAAQVRRLLRSRYLQV